VKQGWSEVALGEVLMPRTEVCSINPEGQYQEVTVSLWGKGVRLRRKIVGSAIASSSRNVARTGDFIISKIDARNGAYGFIPPELDGGVVTNDFPLFSVVEGRVNPRWIYWVSRSRFFIDLCRASSEGTTNRVRLKESKFAHVRIPLPPLAEQQRLVGHLDAIESRLARAQELRAEAATEAQAFTISLHHHLSKGSVGRLDELLRLDEESVPIVADGSYPQAGIRSFGEGMFRKAPTLGSETTYRAFNVLRTGKLVMSQVKGWEGAVAVCPADLDGWFVSPEYRTFSCREENCAPDYLAHLVKTRWFQQHLAKATRGVGARRERIRPEMLLGIEIPFPSLAGQKAALKSIEHLTQAHSLASQAAPHTEAPLPSLLDRIFNQ
jgi:type I restriction enzyme S subunit